MTGPFAVQPLVLVVEDEPRAGRSLASTLASHGLRTLETTTRAADLGDAVAHEPDLVLIDITHAGVDGLALTSRLRDWMTAPIVAILDASSKDGRAAILDAGANDYVLAPVRAADLLARVRVWLRQRSKPTPRRLPSEPASDRFCIDQDRRTLMVDGREVHITPLECKVLLALAYNGGRALTEEQILRMVWGPTAKTRSEYLRAHVRQLRQKLEKDPARPRYLLTEVGGGYRLKLGS